MSAPTTASAPAVASAPASASAAATAPATVPATVPADERRAEQRGRLVLADKVVAKIAGQAAAEVTGTAGRSGGVFGIGATADTAARPKVHVELSADSADLSIEIGVLYPTSIRQATQQIRERVVERVQELTGVAVHRVDVDVTFLTTAGTGTDGRHEHREALR